MANVKLSQIASGGTFVPSTDNIVTVRNGNTDVLTTLGTASVENLATVIIDDGVGNLTVGANQITDAMMATSTDNTLAGYDTTGAFGTVTVSTGLQLIGGVLTATGGGGSGTVTSVSVVSANGFAGTVATATTTPAITISTSITGVLLGNGTSISASNVTDDVQTKAAIVPNTAPSAGQLLVGNAGGTAYTPVSSSGDVTIASTGATTIGNNKVTYAKMQQASTVTLLGNPTGGTANLEEITLGTNLSFSGNVLNATGGGSSAFNAITSGTNTTAAMVVGSGATLGVSGSGTVAATSVSNATFTTALTVDTGTLTLTANAANTSVLTIGAGAVSVSGSNTGDQTNISGNAATVTTNANLTGPVTSIGNATTITANAVTTTTINNAAVTLAKIQNASSNSILLGSGASGSGSAYTEIALGTNLSMSGTTLNASGSGGYAPIPTTVVTGTTQNMSTNNAYVSNNAAQVVFTLPTTFAVGDEMMIMGLGAGGWSIAQNASQLIHFGNQVTTTGTGGSLSSGTQYDTVHLKALVVNTTLTVIGTQGSMLGI